MLNFECSQTLIYFQIVSIFKQRGCLDVSGVPESPLKISEQESSYVGKGEAVSLGLSFLRWVLCSKRLFQVIKEVGKLLRDCFSVTQIMW